MKKFFLLTCLGLSMSAIAQKKDKPLSPEQSQAIMDQVKIDSAAFLRSAGKSACDCIAKAVARDTDKKTQIDSIAACIDKQVEAYELSIQLFRSLKSKEKNQTITINQKGTETYTHYYFEIERWLKDSCAEMNKTLLSNNVEGEKSFSQNADAMAAYNKGVALLEKEDYEACLPLFEKAVSIDPEFAFAWDNLGICYRHTNQYGKAEAAYKTSLKLDPSGKTPLMNLAIVYVLEKKDDEAIAAYNNILKYYPGDPETYYGIAIVYFENKKDMEKALDNMCKAYNMYVKDKSPFRTDAEKLINSIYTQMKKDNKEEAFYRILKENNISAN